MSDDRKPFAHGGESNDSGAPAAAPQDDHPEPSHSVPTPPEDVAPGDPARAQDDTEGYTPADLARDDEA